MRMWPAPSPVVWCSFCCNAAPVHLWWACGVVLSPFLQEAAHREQTTLSQSDLTSSHSSCEKPSSSAHELLVRRQIITHSANLHMKVVPRRYWIFLHLEIKLPHELQHSVQTQKVTQPASTAVIFFVRKLCALDNSTQSDHLCNQLKYVFIVQGQSMLNVPETVAFFLQSLA